VAWEPHSLGWGIAGLDMIGSTAFGVRALAAFSVPSTGDMLDTRIGSTSTANALAPSPGD
jgi:hypothetical protein